MWAKFAMLDFFRILNVDRFQIVGKILAFLLLLSKDQIIIIAPNNSSGSAYKIFTKVCGKGRRESYLDFTEDFVTVKQQNPITTNKPFKG